ncbi:MFS transporter [Myxococcota bacterium]
MRHEKIRLGEKLGYATGDTASVLYFHTFSQFLMYFYTDVFGLTAAAVGTMFLATRLFDAFNDPLMGMIADRTQSKYGKFRPWLLWGIGPYVVLGVLTFTVPGFSDRGRLVYAYVTYVAVSVVYTMVNIPYGALMGVMTSRSEERTVLASFRFYGAYAAVFLVNLTLLKLVRWLGGGDEAAGFQRTMMLYASLGGLLLFITFSTTRERVQPRKDQQSGLSRDLRQLIQNRPWLAVCGIGVLTLIGVSLRNAAIMYFMKYCVVADAELTTAFLTAGTLATLGGVVFTQAAETRLGGKRRAYITLSISSAVVGAGFYFVGRENIALVFAIHVVASALNGPLMPLFWSMIADTADYAEWQFKRRFTGLVFSAGTFSQKSGWALGSAVGGWFLAWYGYDANIDQAPTTLEGIRQLMSFVPSGISLLSAAAVLLYGITPQLGRQIERELVQRKGTPGD